MATPRKLADARNGLSYVDANQGRLVTFEDDVLGVKKEILDRWSHVLDCVWDEVDMQFVIYEKCPDGDERLLFATDTLDRRVIERIHRAYESDPEDLLHEIDKQNAQLEKDKIFALSEKTGDAIERLQLAMHQDGITNRPKVFIGEEYRDIVGS